MIPATRKRMFLIVVFVLVSFACAGRQTPITVEPGEKPVVIKASNFKFKPDYLKARKGEVLTLQVENVSGTTHNLTVMSPEGKLLADVDIPPKGSATTKVRLAEAGIYPFHCHERFHSTLGMKGKIEVSP